MSGFLGLEVGGTDRYFGLAGKSILFKGGV